MPELLPLPTIPCSANCPQGWYLLCSSPLEFKRDIGHMGLANKPVTNLKNEVAGVDQSAVAFSEVRYRHEVDIGIVAVGTRRGSYYTL